MPRGTFSVFSIALLLYALTRAAPTPYNEHVVEADALVHGHVWVENPPDHEYVENRGRKYLLHPPLSAIVLMPLSAVFGLRLDQTVVCVILGALNVALAWRLFTILELAAETRAWLTAFFALGTVMWFEATLGAAWGFALVLSCAPTLLALSEAFGRRRPILLGLWMGLAALARYDLVLAWPIYALLQRREKNWRAWPWLALGALPAVAIYLAWSYARFAGFADQALWRWYELDSYGYLQHPGGPFNLRNLPFNLYTALFMAPAFSDRPPWIHPTFMGQALVFTSPALILCLRARDRRAALMWLATGFVMIPPLTVYANGFSQFGARYWIQALPFLLVLMAIGVRNAVDQEARILIVLSILLVSYGMWHIRTIGFGG